MSWKQYGGINKHESMNNINLNSLSVESLRLTGKYIGDFDVSGNLNASVLNIAESLTIEKDIIIKRDLTVNGNVNATGTLSFTDLGLTGNLVVAKNINAGNNIQTSGNLIVANNIFMGQNQQTFFHLENGNVGLNTYVPNASLDICGNAVSVLNVFSNKEESKNILVRNQIGNGIVLSANSTASAINFYTDSPVNLSNTPTSYITATSAGNLLIDAKTTAQISSNVVIGNRYDLTQIAGESLTVFDNPTNNLLHNSIYNVGNANVGSGLKIYANNNSSSTSLYMITPAGKGTSIISGTYPLDNTRSMMSVNYSDAETGNIVPSQMIVSGNNAGKIRSTTGFNTYAPKTEKYVVDINGPIHVTNGYIKDAKSVNMEIKTVSRVSQFQQNIVALGSPSDIVAESYKQYCYYSTDGGQIWTRSNVNPGGIVASDIESSIAIFSSVYSYDASFSIAISYGTSVDKVTNVFYTADGGKNWYQFGYQDISGGSSVYIDFDRVYIGYNNYVDYFRNPYTTNNLSQPFPKQLMIILIQPTHNFMLLKEVMIHKSKKTL
jgi:hypothetical protein